MKNRIIISKNIWGLLRILCEKYLSCFQANIFNNPFVKIILYWREKRWFSKFIWSIFEDYSKWLILTNNIENQRSFVILTLRIGITIVLLDSSI